MYNATNCIPRRIVHYELSKAIARTIVTVHRRVLSDVTLVPFGTIRFSSAVGSTDFGPTRPSLGRPRPRPAVCAVRHRAHVGDVT